MLLRRLQWPLRPLQLALRPLQLPFYRRRLLLHPLLQPPRLLLDWMRIFTDLDD